MPQWKKKIEFNRIILFLIHKMSYIKIIIKNNGTYNILDTRTSVIKEFSSKGNCVKKLKGMFYEKDKDGNKIPKMDIINTIMKNNVTTNEDGEVSQENLKLIQEIEEKEKKYKELLERQKLLDRLQELNDNISKMENNISKTENNFSKTENNFSKMENNFSKMENNRLSDIDLVPSIDSPTMTITKHPLPKIIVPSTGEEIKPSTGITSSKEVIAPTISTGLPKQIKIGHYQKVCDVHPNHNITYEGKAVGRVFYFDIGDFEDERYEFQNVKGNGLGTMDEFGELTDNFGNPVPIYHFEENIDFFKLIGLNTPNFRESPCFCRYNFTPLNPLLNLDEKVLYPSIIQYGIVRTRQSVKIFEEIF